MLAVARSKIADPHVQFVQGDVRHLSFEENTFGVVVSTWVIEIMADPRAVVQEFIRVLKPHGIVIYAFCSLPEGSAGTVFWHILVKTSSREGPLTHLLNKARTLAAMKGAFEPYSVRGRSDNGRHSCKMLHRHRVLCPLSAC